VLLHERALNKRLDATEDVLFALARAVEARDRYTIHHAERVGLVAREIGRGLGLSPDDLLLLYQGGVLHDLGKIAIPDAILLKPGPLTEEEFATMRTHSAEGERICGSLRTTTPYLPIIRHHHERIDGRGYPDHLVGRDIPIGARIAAISDAWDAMVSDRPYRAGLGQEEALQQLRTGAGTQWDAELVGSSSRCSTMARSAASRPHRPSRSSGANPSAIGPGATHVGPAVEPSRILLIDEFDGVNSRQAEGLVHIPEDIVLTPICAQHLMAWRFTFQHRDDPFVFDQRAAAGAMEGSQEDSANT
jgi:hypothetical protein